MGVDYFPCKGCQEIICDCGEFYRCECSSFCVDCFKELERDGFRYSKNRLDACWFCTKNRELRRVTNEELLEWLMKISGKSSDDYLNHLAEQGEFNTLDNSTEDSSDQDE